MFELYNNITCVQAGWLYNEAQIMSKSNYKQLSARGIIEVLRRGCKGTPALVSFESLPQKFKSAIVEQYGNPKEQVKHFSFTELIEVDYKAREFYIHYKLDDGRNLPENRVQQYIAEAEILNACKKAVEKSAKRGSSKRLWENLSDVINRLDKKQYPHQLPTNPRRLKGDKNTRSYRRYIKQGYEGIIHKGYCNDNSRKVSAQLERLIINLYCLPQKPHMSVVHGLYLQYMGGAFEVVDVKTGEIIDRDLFIENGAPIIVSEGTVWNYLNDPANKVIIARYRNGAHDFSHKVSPHAHRTKPEYSLSKISLDDRDIGHTKMPDGRRVKAYYAFDVASTACIGIAHSKDKTHDLFLNCIRNMFRFLRKNELGIPGQIEVEHHLVKDFEADGLMKAGVVFPLVRWCTPGNSQEKRSEHFIRVKKYGVEKRNNQNVGRFYARNESNRVINAKIYDSENDNYKEPVAPFETIAANDYAEMMEYNNELHPNQKKYKGMTRLEVLLFNVNEELRDFEDYVVARYAGDKVVTTIRRNQYIQVRNEKFQLKSPYDLRKLAPNNYTVEAYFLPEENGEIKRVFAYQNGNLISQCEPIPTFNEAKAEWTEKDEQGFEESMKYLNEFKKMVKDDLNSTISKVELLPNNTNHDDLEVEVMEDLDQEEEFDTNNNFDIDDINRRALDSL